MTDWTVLHYTPKLLPSTTGGATPRNYVTKT